MAGRIEEHSPARVPLLWHRGSQRDRALHGGAQVVRSEVKVHDRRPWPGRGDMSVDLLRYQHSPGDLDPNAGLPRPQLAATEQRPVEVGEPLRVGTVQRDPHQPRGADLGHRGTLRPVPCGRWP